MHCLVHTRPDKGISITYADPHAWRALTCGGGFLTRIGRTFEDCYRWAMIAGRDPEETTRWLLALEHGAHSEAEAWDLIRKRSVPKDHTQVELWPVSEISTDRWFRSAWRRSQNGGPIVIAAEPARDQQKRRIGAALDRVNRRRRMLWLPKIKPDFDRLRAALQRATEPEEIRAVWPEELA